MLDWLSACTPDASLTDLTHSTPAACKSFRANPDRNSPEGANCRSGFARARVLASRSQRYMARRTSWPCSGISADLRRNLRLRSRTQQGRIERRGSSILAHRGATDVPLRCRTRCELFTLPLADCLDAAKERERSVMDNGWTLELYQSNSDLFHFKP